MKASTLELSAQLAGSSVDQSLKSRRLSGSKSNWLESLPETAVVYRSVTVERSLVNPANVRFPSPGRFVYSWNLIGLLCPCSREWVLLEETAPGLLVSSTGLLESFVHYGSWCSWEVIQKGCGEKAPARTWPLFRHHGSSLLLYSSHYKQVAKPVREFPGILKPPHNLNVHQQENIQRYYLYHCTMDVLCI